MRRTILKHHNDLIGSSTNFSTLEFNILYTCLTELEQEKKRIELVASEYFGSDLIKIKNATYSLATKTIKIPKDRGEVLNLKPFERVEYEHGVIDITFSKEFLNLLDTPFEKGNYTLFNVETALKLDSKYAKHLYLIFSRWRNLGEWIVRVDDLRNILHLFDEEGNALYKNNSFLIKYLNKCISEINEKSDMLIELIPVRVGAKYRRFNFIIKNKDGSPPKVSHNLQYVKYEHSEENSNSDVKEFVEKYGIRLSVYNKYAVSLSLNEVKILVERAEARFKTHGYSIASKPAYFIAMMINFITEKNCKAESEKPKQQKLFEQEVRVGESVSIAGAIKKFADNSITISAQTTKKKPLSVGNMFTKEEIQASIEGKINLKELAAQRQREYERVGT